MARELKYRDTGPGSEVNLPRTSFAYHDILCPILHGSASGQVVGRRYRVVKISYKCALQIPPTQTANDTSDIVRLVCFVDTQHRGTPVSGTGPAMDGVLQQATDGVLNFWNKENEHRYIVLVDRYFSLNDASATTGGAGVAGSAHHFIGGSVDTDIIIDLAVDEEPTGNWIYFAGTSHNDAAECVFSVRVEYEDML